MLRVVLIRIASLLPILAGISVVTFAYDKVYLGGGGIHCSTAPLVRDAA